jgi:hypothetical protein
MSVSILYLHKAYILKSINRKDRKVQIGISLLKNVKRKFKVLTLSTLRHLVV